MVCRRVHEDGGGGQRRVVSWMSPQDIGVLDVSSARNLRDWWEGGRSRREAVNYKLDYKYFSVVGLQCSGTVVVLDYNWRGRVVYIQYLSIH